ncbi:MAG: glycosyltransferase, partial [Candidatus Bathyarchaeota archaeon]
MVTKKLCHPIVSIVVCTRNRVKLLKRCIDSLLSLDYPKSNFEIILVDNNSEDETKQFLFNNYPNIKYVFENNIGIPYARNAGVNNANGSIIAFIDDDCVPEKNWLKELIKGFKSDKIIGVGGPTYPFSKKVSNKNFVDPILGTFDGGSQERYINYIGTGNSAFRCEAFNLSHFDVNLKRFEDVLFCLTLRQFGYKILYVPSAIIYATTSSNRFGIKPIIKRAFDDGLSYAYLNFQIRN